MNWLCRLFPWLPGCKPATLPPTPPVPPEPGDIAGTLLQLHNAQRASRRLPPLALNNSCNSAAAKHAALTARQGNLSHQLPGEPDMGDRLTAAGLAWGHAGENIAAGQQTAAEAVTDWMNSQGHRANILGAYTLAGFGVSKGSDGWLYWCAVFASPLVAGSRQAASLSLPGVLDRRN